MMGRVTEIRTERLLMRQWRDSDREPFAALNSDPEVMAHFPRLLTRKQSDAMADRCAERLATEGYGLWALETLETGRFIGFTGLAHATFVAHFTPAIEVGWRLARDAWGHGYATEAARASLTHAFRRARLDEVVSMTATTNLPSRRVMQRIGMTRDPADDFDHPALEVGHRLRRHVLYRITPDRWRETR